MRPASSCAIQADDHNGTGVDVIDEIRFVVLHTDYCMIYSLLKV